MERKNAPDPFRGFDNTSFFLRIFLPEADSCHTLGRESPNQVSEEVPIPVILRAGFIFVLAAGVSVSPALASRVHRAPTSGHAHSSHHAAVAPKTKKTHGQQAIDSQRVTAIQAALIREHYLSGEPSAKWDADTQAAMLKFQADQGWQTKLTPDSRALIKLGLGPNHSSAINGGNGATFNTLTSPAALPATSAQGFVAASGVSH